MGNAPTKEGGRESKDRANQPMGPFAPPIPTEAEEDNGPTPMAVQNDIDTINDKSFLPTTASLDQMDEDVARKFAHPGSKPGTRATRRPDSNEATRAMESPPSYGGTDESGFRHLEELREGDEETGRDKS